MIELDENHKYKINGKSYPRVSEIISHFGFNDFSMVPDRILQPAIDFGNAVHEVIRLTELGDTKSFNEDHRKIQKHWKDALNYIHWPVECIIDVKTFKKPKYSNLLQLFAYKLLIETSDKHIHGTQVEHRLFSKTWQFCGKPDYFNYLNKIKKLYIVTIPDLNGFDPKKNVFVYDVLKDKRYEEEFKVLLKTYQIQKREGLI